jgi:RHS repeat-associated protein
VIDASGTQQQYRYDCAGRLAQVLDGSGSVLATYSYGAGNQRLMSVEGGVTKYFAWAGGKIIAEYEAWRTNALIWKTSYIYLGGQLLATTSGADGSETRFHHADPLGTRLVTDAGGTVVSEQLSLPFGTMLPFTQTYGGENSYQHPTLANPSKKRFTTYDRSDATGLDYAVNRFYSSQLGRFTQVDPIEMGAASLSDPQTLNLYAYCGNDPINCFDPDGLFGLGFIRSFFKAIGRAIVKVVKAVIARVFSASIGGSSGPGLRTPPTFGGSIPGTGIESSGGLGGFRTPPFVGGFLASGQINLPVFDLYILLLSRLLGNFLTSGPAAIAILAITLKSGKAEAERRVRNNAACANAFGGLDNALAALNTTKYENLGTPTAERSGPVTSYSQIGAQTSSDGKISVNSRGAFVRGGAYDAVEESTGARHRDVRARIRGVSRSYDYSGDDFRAFVLLHEVGHGTKDESGFEPDRSNAAAGRRNNDRVYNACFKQ